MLGKLSASQSGFMNIAGKLENLGGSRRTIEVASTPDADGRVALSSVRPSVRLTASAFTLGRPACTARAAVGGLGYL